MISERYKNHVAQLQKFAEQSKTFAEQHTDDFLAQIIAKNHKQVADEATKEYALAEKIEQGSVIDFRFIGNQANGSIPLEYFLKIFEPFNIAIKRAACNLLSPNKSTPKMPTEISQSLNLRLAGILPGSTRILISGAIEKDCTNQSVFSDSMNEIFSLLNADEERISEKVHTVGETSARYLKEALKTTKSLGLAVELTWSQPNKEPQNWEGSVDNINRVVDLLNDFTVEKEYEESVTGVIQSISRQAVKIKKQNNHLMSIKYSKKILPFVQTLSILKDVTLNVHTKKYFNESTQEYAYDHRLLNPAENDLITN